MLNTPAAVQHPGQRLLAVRRHRHCHHTGRLSPVFTASELERCVRTAQANAPGKVYRQGQPFTEGAPVT